MLRRVHITLLFSLIVGCQAYGPTSGYWSNPLGPGAEIEVKRSIRIPAGLARVYVQYGETLGYAAMDQYAPFCYFLMREPLPMVQTIRPGMLRIESVSLNETEVRRALPARVAALMLFAGADGDGRGVIAMQSYMRVASAEQPDVYALVCSGAFAAPAEAKPIRLHELREVLGPLADVRAWPDSVAD
ncbi:MAG: hypothetical protein PVI91_16410 [Gammaproteobacteria bacterium]|jgi:hypothetical protein